MRAVLIFLAMAACDRQPVSPECAQYLDCIDTFAEGAIEQARATAAYGPRSDCWDDATSAARCTAECALLRVETSQTPWGKEEVCWATERPDALGVWGTDKKSWRWVADDSAPQACKIYRIVDGWIWAESGGSEFQLGLSEVWDGQDTQHTCLLDGYDFTCGGYEWFGGLPSGSFEPSFAAGTLTLDFGQLKCTVYGRPY